MADSTLNRFLASGTAAERAAFTPTPPTPASGPDSGYFWFETDTEDTYSWDGAVWVKVNTASGVPDPIVPADGTQNITGALTVSGAITGSNLSGTNTGNQTTIVGITGTTAQFNTALTDGDFATGGGTVTGTSSGTNTGDQTITLTGNVTGSGTGSFATTIAASAVTLAMQANMATASVVYRKTAGAGAPEVQTLATLKTDLGLTGTNSGDQTITLTGDVTGSGTGSFAATIAADSVTLAKIANAAANSKLLGSGDAGSGVNYVEITLGTNLTMSGTTLNATGGGGSTPTGTGFTHITAGVQDAAAKLVDTADVNDAQITLAKMANMATSSLIYRKTASSGVPEVNTLATLKTDLGLTGTNSGDQTITLTGNVTGSGTGSFATTIAADAVANSMLADMTALTVKANATNATANPTDVAASSDGQVFLRSGTTLAFGTVATAGITDAAVTLAKMANMATASLIYRKTASSGVPEVNTLATLKTDLGLTGTNSGDQTTIVGITGTLAQFNTACTDANFARVDAANSFSGVQSFLAQVTIDAETVIQNANPQLTLKDTTGGGATDGRVSFVDSADTEKCRILASGGTLELQSDAAIELDGTSVTALCDTIINTATPSLYLRDTAGTSSNNGRIEWQGSAGAVQMQITGSSGGDMNLTALGDISLQAGTSSDIFLSTDAGANLILDNAGSSTFLGAVTMGDLTLTEATPTIALVDTSGTTGNDGKISFQSSDLTERGRIVASSASYDLSIASLGGDVIIDTNAGSVCIFDTAGETFFNVERVNFDTPNSGHASIRLPHGTAPSSPANGDVWSTATGIFGRVTSQTMNMTVLVGTTAPTSPATGDLWVDTN